eukprot:COSAG02_NODE_28260_length_593_cov_0.483806_1_plen_134_part_10
MCKVVDEILLVLIWWPLHPIRFLVAPYRCFEGAVSFFELKATPLGFLYHLIDPYWPCWPVQRQCVPCLVGLPWLRFGLRLCRDIVKLAPEVIPFCLDIGKLAAEHIPLCPDIVKLVPECIPLFLDIVKLALECI